MRVFILYLKHLILQLGIHFKCRFGIFLVHLVSSDVTCVTISRCMLDPCFDHYWLVIVFSILWRCISHHEFLIILKIKGRVTPFNRNRCMILHLCTLQILVNNFLSRIMFTSTSHLLQVNFTSCPLKKGKINRYAFACYSVRLSVQYL